MPKYYIVLLVCVLYGIHLTAQTNQKTRKTYHAQKIDQPPKIDGILKDDVWKEVVAAEDFVMFEPGDGDPIDAAHETLVKLVYDNEAIYIAGYMFDNHPDQILKQFSQRDNIEQAEFFLIDINTYDDGENQTRFIVTAAGTQADGRITGNNEDFSYNVVWDSAIYHDNEGWYVEMKIPYSALRFPEKPDQQWGIQFYREIKHLNESYLWNYVDKSVGQLSQYNGLLEGISDIDPPVRLSFYPYTQAAVDVFDGVTEANFSAGMDLKYGINDSFTLDMTLIPDFGQTAYDEVELNLGPFEQVFGENRAFFTEGTELFNKGDLFYSRRVGSSPSGFNDAQRSLLENEKIIQNPDRTDLINALKISGRTDKGLGVGFFNAVTAETEAVIRDTLTGQIRKQLTEPLANYNILVLDQRFNRNSSLTLINTNVTRDGSFRDGNVTGFLFDIFNKSNSFNFAGEAKMSNVNLPSGNKAGFASAFSVERTKGNFRYSLEHQFANETYDINDLGINLTNNYNNFEGGVSYQIFEPQGNYNTYNIRLFGQHLRRYSPDVTVNTGIGGGFFAFTRNRFAFGGNLSVNSEFKDFFETRLENTYITYRPFVDISGFVSSDYRKKFAYDVRLSYADYFKSEQNSLSLSIEPRYRFNDKFSFVYEFQYGIEENRDSFVEKKDLEVYFGKRDQQRFENSLRASYNFNTKQAINLSFRNFWSTAYFSEGDFTRLGSKGNLRDTNFMKDEFDPDANFNIWNLDLSYRWQFAPGSEAVLLYRNSIFNQDKLSMLGYQESLENLFAQPARHNLSLRIVYFLDYLQVKKLFKN